MPELEDNIRSAVSFSEITATGFHTLKCPVCNDTRTRAGFRFEIDKIVYNCFRGKCDASTEYEYDSTGMYKKFRELMSVFSIDIPISLRAQHRKKKTVTKLNEKLYEEHHYDDLKLPSDFVQYHPDYHYWFDDFLKKRHAEFGRDLYVGKEDTWNNKLIIPFYHNHKLIGWQGVSVYDNGTFYQTSSDNTDIMFINNKQGFIHKNPIIVEGIMDAVVIPDSIAILGNSVSKKQAYMLKDSNPILLPDRSDSKFIDIAKRYGWSISIPEWKVKDANEAVQKYGMFVMMKMVHDGIQNNIKKAEVRYKLWERNKKKRRS